MNRFTDRPENDSWRRGGRVVAVLASLALLLAACGSDGDDEASGEESTDTSAAETDESTDTSAAETDESSDASEDEAGDALQVELGEWFLEVPDGLTAGTLSFAIDNVGENPHAFAIARGTSYEELPQKDNGAVDTDALGDDFLGSTDNIASGESGAIEFDLDAGDYVFFCPIEFGPNSHAANGQVLSVTVGG